MTVDTGPDWVTWLRERLGQVVSFLEDLISVRYYPPITFLVDEHVVRATREVLTVDAPPADSEDDPEHVLKILQALALKFHIGKLLGSGIPRDQRAVFFGAHAGQARTITITLSPSPSTFSLGRRKTFLTVRTSGVKQKGH